VSLRSFGGSEDGRGQDQKIAACGTSYTGCGACIRADEDFDTAKLFSKIHLPKA
jgi:hypothetical protein